jgi:hypothetical protein
MSFLRSCATMKQLLSLEGVWILRMLKKSPIEGPSESGSHMRLELQGLEEPMLHKFENSEQVLATKVGRVIVSGRSRSASASRSPGDNNSAHLGSKHLFAVLKLVQHWFLKSLMWLPLSDGPSIGLFLSIRRIHTPSRLSNCFKDLVQVVAQLLKKDILPNTYVHQLLDLPETITLPTLVALAEMESYNAPGSAFPRKFYVGQLLPFLQNHMPISCQTHMCISF